MLKILLKKQMAEVFRSYFYDAKKNKARSKAAVAAYIVLFVVIMLGVLGGMFTLLALSMSAPMAAAGMDWLYFALMGLLAILLGSFGSVFNTYSGLYLAKDNDLLSVHAHSGQCDHGRAAAQRLPAGADVLGRGHPACRDCVLVYGFGQSGRDCRLDPAAFADQHLCAYAVLRAGLGGG